MKIRVYCISKPEKDAYAELGEHFKKLARSFNVELEILDIFNKQIAQAQKAANEAESSLAYREALQRYLSGAHNIALTPEGKLYDSHAFSQIFHHKQEVNFFIGGAYGFEPGFLKSCHQSLSLSPLTLGHKVAKVVLCEQIYRGLAIMHNHPYHK